MHLHLLVITTALLAWYNVVHYIKLLFFAHILLILLNINIYLGNNRNYKLKKKRVER